MGGTGGSGDPRVFAQHVRDRVLAETDLHCGVGIGDNKLRAKIATAFGKIGEGDGSGIGYLTEHEWFDVMGERPTTALWGIGSKIGKRLAALGIHTVRELAESDARMLAEAIGPTMGPWYHRLGRGADSSPVDATPWVPRAHGREETYQTDLTWDVVPGEVRALTSRVVADIDREGRPAARVGLKVRYRPLITVSRSVRCPRRPTPGRCWPTPRSRSSTGSSDATGPAAGRTAGDGRAGRGLHPMSAGRQDWRAWHRDYDDAGSSVSRRLVEVRARLVALLTAGDGPVRLLNLCSGDARDTVPVLAGSTGRSTPVWSPRPRVSPKARGGPPPRWGRPRGAHGRRRRRRDVRRSAPGRRPDARRGARERLGRGRGADHRRGGGDASAWAAPSVWSRSSRFRAEPTHGYADPAVWVRDRFEAHGFETVEFVVPEVDAWRIGISVLRRPLSEPLPDHLFTFVAESARRGGENAPKWREGWRERAESARRGGENAPRVGARGGENAPSRHLTTRRAGDQGPGVGG